MKECNKEEIGVSVIDVTFMNKLSLSSYLKLFQPLRHCVLNIRERAGDVC